MRKKFASDQELSNAQIYGTTSGKPKKSSKKKGFRRTRR